MEGLEEIFQGFKDAILESIGEGISIIGKDMKIVWANPVIEKWAGRLEDIKKRYCYQVYQKRDDLCQNCPSVKTLRTGKTEKARQYGYDTRGKIKYFEFISAPIRDEQGEIIAVVELATDLTEKIELEHKL
ncbi:PAS domain-containing protein, partial [bacterium]|nr:PAS domain-containing protein [bacterium]